MKINKKVLGHLEKCYALAPITYEGEPHFLVASELARACLLFDLDGNQKDVVWEKPGGVMSMVYVPGTNGQFLTTHRFFSFNDAAEASISVVTPKTPGNWEIRTLVDLPFVHRIDIVERGGVKWLIACQLKSGHEYENDWRYPGKVFVAALPDSLDGFDAGNQLRLTLLMDGLPKNHGYYRQYDDDGVPYGIISAENGVFRIVPPENAAGKWETTRLLDVPASDAVLLDFDGDGENELGLITPFHGDRIRFYDRDGEGYRLTYEHPEALPFLHGFYGGPICGKQTLLVGHRSGARDLLAFRYDDGEKRYCAELLDHDVGPANLLVYQKDGADVLISANREIDEIAMYTLTES